MLIWIRNNLLFILFALSLVRCGASEEALLPDIPYEEFRSGDVAFRLGCTLESDVIAAADDDFGYSHVGVIISEGDALRVIHIEPEREGEERIKAELLEEFFHPSRAVKGVVVRRKDVSIEQRQMIEREALQLLDLKVCFDHDYSLQDTTTMYCSELVDFLFRGVGISLTHKRYDVPLVDEDVILPSSMLSDGEFSLMWSYDLRSARHN